VKELLAFGLGAATRI